LGRKAAISTALFHGRIKIMRASTLILAAALVTAPVQAMAQANDTGEVDVGDTHHNDDGNSRLGLLGLLGLAGLLGLRRREPDIHVDARRDTRP
jgi:MYXO-CTERM domain-containing protein